MIGKLPSMILFDALHWMRPRNTNMDFRSADFDDCVKFERVRQMFFASTSFFKSNVNSAAVRLFL